MKDKCKLVAISINQNQVFLVKNVSDQEYEELLNRQHKSESESERRSCFHDGKHKTIEDRLSKVEKKNLILAKSIYDNFVDRGLIENDDYFQQMWFDFYFNDKELNNEKYPSEFSKILEKVVNF